MESHGNLSTDSLDEDRSRVLINVVIAFLVLQTFFLILYIISRIMNRTFKAWDVYFMFIAYIWQLATAAVALLSIVHGGNGRHIATVKPDVVDNLLKITTAEEFIYLYAVMFPKLSILCFYWRVFPLASYRCAVYVIQSVVILTCIAGTIANVALCKPVAYHWNPRIPGGHCGSKAMFYRAMSAPNLITDVSMLVLPLYGIWQLRIKIRNKIGASIVFMTGCIGILTAFARLIIFIKLDWFPDFTWSSVVGMGWALVEPAMYTIAGMLPSLAPLVRYFCGDIEKKTSKNVVARVRSCCGLARKTSSNNDVSEGGPHAVNVEPNAKPSEGYTDSSDLSEISKSRQSVSFVSSAKDSSIDMV